VDSSAAPAAPRARSAPGSLVNVAHHQVSPMAAALRSLEGTDKAIRPYAPLGTAVPAGPSVP
jgi:hypothetical protein